MHDVGLNEDVVQVGTVEFSRLWKQTEVVFVLAERFAAIFPPKAPY